MQKLDEKLISSIERQDWLDEFGTKLQNVLKDALTGSPTGQGIKDFLHGTWLAHPVHAVTTDVAIGAWTTAQVMDLAEAVVGYKHWGSSTMAIGVGLGGALTSAASGLVDWTDTYGDQKRLGLIHAIVNVTAALLYVGSLGSRIAGNRGMGKTLSALGFSTVLVGGYIGGDLAYRLGTQVDRNAWARDIKEFTPVMAEAELQPDKPTRVESKGQRIMLVKRGETVFALSDNCAHAGCSLTKGHLEGDTIVCSCHGSTYDLRDGTVLHGPAVYAQPSYEVRINAGQIEIKSMEF